MARRIEEFRSIVIPHLRHAFDTIDQLHAEPRIPAGNPGAEG
jgi:hypothetical protein